MTEQKMDYLTEEELEKLIEDVEMHGMLECPSYVRQEVLEKTRVSLRKRKQQFYIYSLKVWAASAAAIVLLFTLPSEPQMAEFAEAPAEQFSITDKLSRHTSSVCESLNDFTDMLIYRESQEEY